MCTIRKSEIRRGQAERPTCLTPCDDFAGVVDYTPTFTLAHRDIYQGDIQVQGEWVTISREKLEAIVEYVHYSIPCITIGEIFSLIDGWCHGDVESRWVDGYSAEETADWIISNLNALRRYDCPPPTPVDD